ncbi:MAG TPA: RNA polymerase sigma factor, partial [Isosphaeraceae bacterium]|nr:RNA polymerase sigma factor [Isosphaeraceae bacterium]
MTRLRGTSSGVLFCQLERLFAQGTASGLTEGELLERFVSRRDEAAFEALVARHGPMVLGVCRHLLRDPNDVDDAFQATFLVLVKKASTVRRCELLGNWLYGVAFRVASRARALAARRTARFVSGDYVVENLTAAVCRDDGGLDPKTLLDQSPWLHQEVCHLPDKYRTPIVLCYFEGLTHDEAASRLGWPLGTVKGRL